MKARSWRRALSLATLAVVLMLATLGGASSASAAPGDPSPGVAQTKQVERQVIVEFGDPVVVQRGERVQTVVSIGGDVTIAGTVDQTVVTVGGDVILRSTANVGGEMARQNASVVVINGELTRATGAAVQGDIEIVDLGNFGDAWEWASERGGWSALSPFASFAGWLVSTVVFLLFGLLAAALMPGQMRAVGQKVMTRPGASLGWGALNVIVLVPVSLVVLAVTIVGLIVVVPAAVVLLFFFTPFVVAAVGTAVVERLFGDRLKGNLMAAVATAVVATSIVGRVPGLGVVVNVAMVFIGTGAAVLAWNAWRLERKALRNGGVPTGGPAGGPYGAPGGAPQGPTYPPQGPAYPPQGYAEPALPGSPGAQPAVAQPPVAQPPCVQPGYPQSPYAQPPIAQAPIGTQAYLHPQYGWIVYPPQTTEGRPTTAGPAGEEPTVEAPTAEAPAVEASTVEAPTVEAPVGEEPTVEVSGSAAETAENDVAARGEEPQHSDEGAAPDVPGEAPDAALSEGEPDTGQRDEA